MGGSDPGEAAGGGEEGAGVQAVARALADAVAAALPPWVERCVADRLGRPSEAAGGDAGPDPAALADAAAAGRAAADDVVPRLRALLEADIDRQSTTPLALVRAAVVYPTRVLAARGVPPVDRDAFAAGRFPEDVYDLTPATMADLGAEVGEAAVAWGAAKAWAHRRRHGPG